MKKNLKNKTKVTNMFKRGHMTAGERIGKFEQNIFTEYSVHNHSFSFSSLLWIIYYPHLPFP